MANGVMIRTDEAMDFLRSLEGRDQVTKSLVNNAMFHLMRRYHERKDIPSSDLDLMYFLELMHEIFSEHEVLKRMLDGEKVGAFFDE